MTETAAELSPQVADLQNRFLLKINRIDTKALLAIEKIEDDETYRQIGESLVTVKALLDEADKLWEEPTSLAHKTWKSFTDLKAKMTKDLLVLKKKIPDLLSARLAFLDQEKAKAEAAKKAELAALETKKDDAILEAAVVLEESGQGELALSLVATTPVPSLPVIAPVMAASPAVEGLNTQEKFVAEVRDFRALCARIGDGQIAPSGPVQDKMIAAIQSTLDKWAAKMTAPGPMICPNSGVFAKKAYNFSRQAGAKGAADGL